jgi:hypothetical protein
MDDQEKRDHLWRIGLILAFWLVAVSLFVIALYTG